MQHLCSTISGDGKVDADVRKRTLEEGQLSQQRANEDDHAEQSVVSRRTEVSEKDDSYNRLQSVLSNSTPARKDYAMPVGF